MTKKLYIIRHAQAEDLGNTRMVRDFERELTSKGIMQSARLGKFLATESVKIDLLLSSPAKRALQTAKVLGEQLKYDEEKILLDENLYGDGPKGYLNAINKIGDQHQSVAIFGHNPDISFFAEYLTREDIGGSMKKATLIELAFTDLEWAEVSAKTADLIRRVDESTIVLS